MRALSLEALDLLEAPNAGRLWPPMARGRVLADAQDLGQDGSGLGADETEEQVFHGSLLPS